MFVLSPIPACHVNAHRRGAVCCAIVLRLFSVEKAAKRLKALELEERKREELKAAKERQEENLKKVQDKKYKDRVFQLEKARLLKVYTRTHTFVYVCTGC